MPYSALARRHVTAGAADEEAEPVHGCCEFHVEVVVCCCLLLFVVVVMMVTVVITCRCGVCGCGIVGQDGAVKHAKDTGHINFQEFK